MDMNLFLLYIPSNFGKYFFYNNFGKYFEPSFRMAITTGWA